MTNIATLSNETETVSTEEKVEIIELESDELGRFDSLAMCDEQPTG
jgi:hypothetical protein